MSPKIGRFAHVPRELVGTTGRRYCFKKLLKHTPQLGSGWVATHGQDDYVLKDLPKDIFSHFNERVWPQLRHDSSTVLRLPIDMIPGRPTFVYRFLMDDFLHLVRENISTTSRSQIIKTTLQAIADLHDHDVVHLGKLVVLIDLENAAHLPTGKCVKGMMAGNDNWRSPEAHLKGELGKPSDMFSFGLVCLYAIFDRIICGLGEDFEKHESQGALPVAIRLQRLVSYFGDQEGLAGLMKHVGDEDTNCQILSMLWEERNAEYIPYKLFSEWPEAEHDVVFRDLIRRLMNLDPGKRITAAQALAHPWFADKVG